MKTTISFLLFTSIFLSGSLLNAQEKQDRRTRPFQVTLVTPVGTNGLESGNYTNNFSLNIIAGYSGGVNGAELGGFANILRDTLRGSQFAGFTNINLGAGKGLQAAGYLNYNQKYFRGAQLSGFTNITLSNIDGAQLSGFANVTYGSMTGVQFSGFANVVRDSIDGFQGSGFTNYSRGCSYGQVSGFGNLNIGSLRGPQLAGFCNINTNELKGLQVAGFTNVNGGRLEGTQISGFLNFTGRLKGLQLGVFNFVDSLEKGAAIGVISFIRNGYHVFEISGNESMYGVLSFKTGTRKFYNILAIGAGVRNEMIYWGWGYGVGTIVPLNANFGLNFEATCFQVNEDEWDVDRLNLHNRLNAMLAVKLNDNITLFGGPSWNVLVTDLTDSDGNRSESTYAPWHTFNKTYKNDINIKMYPGFNVGIRF